MKKTQQGTLTRLFNLTREYPARTVGYICIWSGLPMFYTGLTTANAVLSVAALSFLAADSALAIYGDPRTSDANEIDPQDKNVGAKRLYNFWTYPHEFNATYCTLGTIILILSGLSLSEQESFKPMIEINNLGFDGKALAGLCYLPAFLIMAFVQEKTQEQIDLIRQQSKKASNAAQKLFNKLSDTVRIHPTISSSIIWQLGLIPYTIEAFRSPDPKVTASMLVTVAAYTTANIYYALSSKRQILEPQSIEKPAIS